MSAKITPAGRGISTTRFSASRMGSDEIPVPVVFKKREARELVLELLVLRNPEARFPYRPLRVSRRLGVRLARHGLGDRVGMIAIVALKLVRRPPCPL